METLQLADLSEEEANLFVSLVKHGACTRSQIATLSDKSPIGTYRLLRTLADRGIVKVEKDTRGKFQYAADVDGLLNRVEKHERRLRRAILSLRELQPLLRHLPDDEAAEDDEAIEVREGLDAFREEYLRIPDQCRNEWLSIGTLENFWKVAGFGYESAEERAFIHKRLNRRVGARVINPRSPQMDSIRRNDDRELRQIHFLDTLPVQRDCLAFTDTHVAHFICDQEDPRVIVMRHPELQRIHRNHFAQLWTQGQKV